MVWKVYLLRCCDGSLYCGVTKDVEARVATHNAGRGAKYTRSRLPVEVVAVSPDLEKRRAFQFEYHVKRLPASQKCAAVLQGKGAGGVD
jgi:putative endonuclease